MSTSISMLRGINVGGQKKVSMEELRKCYESLGLRLIKTYIQSGNVVFEDQSVETEELVKKKIEKGIKESFGFDVVVVVRTREQILKVIAGNPFPAGREASMHVTFLSAKPSKVPIEEIDAARGKDEKFSLADREVYLYCPNGYGRTRLSNSFFERKLATTATTRNWRTVTALCSLASS